MQKNDADSVLKIAQKELIDTLYDVFLKRTPEAGGLRAHLERRGKFKSDREWIAATIKLVITSKEYLDLVRQQLFEKTLFVERSQAGEVEILLRHIILSDIAQGAAGKPIIVDVGANGKAISNSYDILKHFPVRGILIEANPELCSLIETDFSGLDVTVVNAAVSDKEEEVSLWVSRAHTHISSLVGARYDDWKSRENFKDLTKDVEFKLVARRLGSILVDNDVPNDFFMMSIDIEGMDKVVLNDLFENSNFVPRYLIVEGVQAGIERDVKRIGKLYDVIGSSASNVIFKRKQSVRVKK